MGIGGPCPAYGEWTPYSQYPAEHCQALFNGCSNFSVLVMVTPSSASVSVTVTTSSASVMVMVTPSSASVYPTPTPQVSETPSGSKCVFPSDVIITMTAINYVYVVLFINASFVMVTHVLTFDPFIAAIVPSLSSNVCYIT